MTPTWIAVPVAIMTVLWSHPAPAGNIVNADMTFTNSQVFDTGDDYFFNNNASSTWRINNGAVVTMPQSFSAVGERFFVGVNDGNTGTLTFTSTSGAPGQLSARGNSYAAMRIGHTTGNSSGIVNIEGGVNLDIGWVFGQGSGTRQLNVNDGRFNVMSDNTGKRLNGIDVTLGSNGALWVQGKTTSKSHFEGAYAPGATLTANGGQPYFQTRVVYDPIAGSSQIGTLITAGDAAPPAPDAELMVIHAHPDDEGIFFGGVLPYYTRVQQRETVLINMVSDRKNKDPTVRETELRNAAAHYGVQNEPVFARFMDHAHLPGGINSLSNAWNTWDGDDSNGVADDNGNGIPDGRDEAALYLAEQIRRYKPEVIVTHDLDGEYGHGAHQATAWVTADAFYLAADASLDVAGLDPWQAQKLYIHQSEANGLGTTGETFVNWLFHDYWEDINIDSDGDGFPDRTPRQIADEGLDFHVSQGQPDVSTVFRTNENFDGHHSEWWGLYASTVGPDTIADPFTIQGAPYESWARGDFFENVVSVPEPSTFLLTAVGLLVLVFYGWRRRRWRSV